MKEIKNIVIVGGGTAGLTTALMLKEAFLNCNIKLITSSKVGIIGVGEGSTEHLDNFLKYVKIAPVEIINATDATLKVGILFNDWNYKGSKYIHSIGNLDQGNLKGDLDLYDQFVLNNSTNPYCLNMDWDKAYKDNNIILNSNFKPTNQYHFDTHKLNKFLTQKCLDRGIIIEDKYIEGINQDNIGQITSLISSENELISGDLFIDCSGFKRVLSTKLGSKWISYKDYLPLNKAITLSTSLPSTKNIEPFTTSTSLKNGWTWKIPTQTRYGHGYVFSDNFINTDNALNELNNHLGVNVEKVSKDIKFEAGKIDKFWINNCVSIGLAGSFVEPLEAQSIGFSIIQTKALISSINSWIFNPNTSLKYNQTMDEVYNNIVDYVQAHYFTKRKDSKFWKNLPFKLTDFNKSTLSRFSYGMFSNIDFLNPYLMFKSHNFYQLYYGLGIITKDTIQTKLKQNPPYFNEYWKDKYIESIQPPPKFLISHKKHLEIIRENQLP